jgi:hypothetical protein
MEEHNKDFDPTQPSRGLGDTVAKITHYTGISKLSEIISEALNIEDCGCSRRQESLNNLISYQTFDKTIEEGEYKVLQNIKINNNEYKIGDMEICRPTKQSRFVNNIFGAYGYIVSFKGAKKLMKFYQEVFVPAD